MSQYCFSLSDVKEEGFPSKIRILSALKGKVSVPNGFFVSDKFVLKILSDSGIVEKINVQLSYVNGSDINSFVVASNNISLILNGLQFSSEVKKLINESYLALSSNDLSKLNGAAREMISVAKDDFSVSVVLVEDDEYLPSFFSEHRINGIVGILESFKNLLMEYYSPVAMYYRFKNNRLNDIPSFLVQEDVFPEKSGFISNIMVVDGDEGKIVCEANKGYLLSVLKGDCSVDKYVIDKETGNLVLKDIPVKEYAFIYEDIDRKVVRKEVRDSSRILELDDLIAAYKLMEEVRSFIGRNIIVSFIISRNRIFLNEVVFVNKNKDNKNDLVGMYDDSRKKIDGGYEFINVGAEEKGSIGNDFLFKENGVIDIDVLNSRAFFVLKGNIFSYTGFLFRKYDRNFVKVLDKSVFEDKGMIELRNGVIYEYKNPDGEINLDTKELQYEGRFVRGTKILLNVDINSSDFPSIIDGFFVIDDGKEDIFSDSKYRVKELVDKVLSYNKKVFLVLGDNDNLFFKNVDFLVDYDVKGYDVVPLLEGFTDIGQIKKMLSFLHSRGYDVINKDVGVYVNLPIQTYMLKELLKAGIKYVFFNLDKLYYNMTGGKEIKTDDVFKRFVSDTLFVFKKQEFEIYLLSDELDMVDFVSIGVSNRVDGLVRNRDLNLIEPLILKFERKMYIDLIKRKYMVN